MLAAIQSLYSSGTLSMKVAGTAGQPRTQQMGVRQGCPLSPTLFGISFDGPHDHLQSCAPMSGMQLGSRSGRWLSSLVYADDVVLLSWSPTGLQLLLDSMNYFCLGLGLVISPTRLLSSMAQAHQVCGMLAARLCRSLPASSILVWSFMNLAACLLLSSDWLKMLWEPGPSCRQS